jgi:PAS domain S-box-containing protein
MDLEHLWEQVGLLAQDPICAFDHDFRLIAFNQAHNDEFFRVNGFYTQIGDVFPDLFIEQQRPVMRSLMARALTGEPFSVVEEFGKPELGAPQWEISYNPLRDRDGRIVGAFHRARDLSDSPIRLQSFVRASDVERQLADAAFRRVVGQLDSQLRDIVEPEAIASLCAEVVGTALSVGSAGFGTMHADGETMDVDRDWTSPGAISVVGTHRLADFGDYIDVLRRGDDFVVADVTLDHRTKHRAAAYAAVNVRSAVNVPILEGGVYVAMFFVLAPRPREWTPPEITFIRNVGERARLNVERRRAERRLRLQADELELQVEQRTLERDRLWETSVDLIVHASYDGSLMRVSPSWTRTLGHDDETLRAMSMLDFIHPTDAEAFAGAIARCQASAEPVRHCCRMHHRDGSLRTIDWSIVPEQGGARFNAVGRDVTSEREAERVKAMLEAQLWQSQKMETVGQLTGGLAHDFNNLLASLSGNLQVLRLRLAQGKIDDLMRRVDAGMDSVRRAATLTQRLLAFARQQTLDSRPTDVNRLIAGMEELIGGTVGPAIRLQVVACEDLWRTKVDPSQLESALLNLCINARDAMAPAGGTLTIRTENETLDAAAAVEHDLLPGEYVSLSVTDTGCGMAPDIITRVFDPFFTTKPLGQGTGLGLSMVYGFLGQSGGQVRIDSKLGQGTTMCLYLPRHVGTMDAEDERAPSGSGGARVGETVLVVEDEAEIRALLIELLEEAGYVAVQAADGVSAMRILQSDAKLDLLLSDVGLPGGMNGRQLADAARIARPGLKVLFLTGYAENAAAWSGHLEPGMHVMTKPFDIAALTARVREVIGP